jgi:hypothetical protein
MNVECVTQWVKPICVSIVQPGHQCPKEWREGRNILLGSKYTNTPVSKRVERRKKNYIGEQVYYNSGDPPGGHQPRLLEELALGSLKPG